MIIKVCDICGHETGLSLSNPFPHIYKVDDITGKAYEMMLCGKCHDRMIEVISLESKKDWEKELKGGEADGQVRKPKRRLWGRFL